MTTRPCKECGTPIVFSKNRATGKPIPIDTRSPVYRYDESGADPVSREEFGVSHFATCRAAVAFSRSAASEELGAFLEGVSRVLEAVRTGADQDPAAAEALLVKLLEFKGKKQWGLG